MSTFTIRKKKKISRNLVSVVIFVVIIAAFLFAINYTSQATLDHQEDSLNQALERDIVMCYAQNGYYPPSLDYIKEHYGLIYDEKTFLVNYQPVADNIRPNYIVIRLGGGSHEEAR